MAKPQLLYGAFDTGPSNYGLDVISYAQRKLNWGVTYFGNNPEFNGLAFDNAYHCLIVGGPSSFNNEMDNYILDIAENEGISVYVLGDSPRSILRPGVKEYIKCATAIVALPSDIPLAKSFGYKDAVWLGYPSHWGNPTTTQRSPIFEYDGVAVRVFVCGLKEATITDNMLASVIGGMDGRGDDWLIYFQAHPSEIAATQNPDRRVDLLAHPRVRELKMRESVASIMVAANVTVCTGGATAVLDGALLRLPVIYYLDKKVMDYMKKQVNDEIWGPVLAGACEKALPDMMVFALQQLLRQDAIGDWVRENLRGKQEAAFPQQPAGMNTVAEVLSYIQNPAGYVPFDAREVK